MTDYSELKKQAEAARDNCPIWYAADCFSLRHMDLGDSGFVAEANPRIVLALIAEVEALRQGLKGDYDLDAWLDWAKEARALRDKVEHLECMTESHKLDAKIHRDVAEFCAKKLRSAEICHPRAVDTLVGEAREALAAYLPEGWPQAAASKEASNG